MDASVARTIRSINDFDRLSTFEENARSRDLLSAEIKQAVEARRAELGRDFVASKTGLQLDMLTPAEEMIVRAVGEYAAIKKRNGTNSGRTISQIKRIGLIAAAEASVMQSKTTQGFKTLDGEDLRELSYEQIIVDHPKEFSARALWHANKTLGRPNASERPPARELSATQRWTQQLISWLKARALDGQNSLGIYTNSEAAEAIGIGDLSRYGRVFGNIQSRIDFACYRLGLPPLGLAAIEHFADAWATGDRKWLFPVSSMRAAAQNFEWRPEVLDRILLVAEQLPASAHASWERELTENQALVRDWAFSLEEAARSVARALTTPVHGQANKTQNPNWTREEHILALELYFARQGTSHDEKHPTVIALSKELLALATIRGMSGNEKFRNPSGVSMKLMNFRRLDPAYTANGRVGLDHANKAEESVWKDFAGDRPALAKAAANIRLMISDARGLPPASTLSAQTPTMSPQDANEIAAILGEAKLDVVDAAARLASLEALYRKATPERKSRVTRFIERGPIGAQVKKVNGHKCQLCEAMGLNPFSFLKKDGTPYVEAHHVAQVSTEMRGCLSASNIMTVCANHHREMHYGKVRIATTDKTFEVVLGEVTLSLARCLVGAPEGVQAAK